MSSVELLMPAGSLEKMKWAFQYGADAVYAGVPLFSLRARENEFQFEELEQGMLHARNLGKKVYLTANIFARNLKLKSFAEAVDNWAKLKPDAMIMSDPGLMSIVREKHPEIPIHLSVQANCMNWQGVKFWRDQGVSRVILSRELRLSEIQEIHDRVPDVELEAFVHGSICIAYSGRCLLSHYMSYRDANQGVCDNSCRYPFKLYKNNEPVSDEFFVEDLRTPGEYYPIDEDEHGTYIMNAKDLCLIENLKEIRDAGVVSFKVEGRTKGEFYVAAISRAYRKAIDDMEAGRAFNPSLLSDLEKLANRGYHKGFMMGTPSHESQNYVATPRGSNSSYLGIVKQKLSATKALVDARAKILPGQQIEFMTPEKNVISTVTQILDKDKNQKPAANPGTGHLFEIAFSSEVEPESLLIKGEVV